MNKIGESSSPSATLKILYSTPRDFCGVRIGVSTCMISLTLARILGVLLK
jgi:hypothetical protein